MEISFKADELKIRIAQLDSELNFFKSGAGITFSLIRYIIRRFRQRGKIPKKIIVGLDDYENLRELLSSQLHYVSVDKKGKTYLFDGIPVKYNYKIEGVYVI